MTTSTPASTTNLAWVDSLKEQLSGRVIVPGDADYDAARVVMAGHVDRHPAAIASVANAKDVAIVIGIARENALPLAVRSGGHDGAGLSVSEGGVVIDLRDMKRIDIDPTGPNGLGRDRPDRLRGRPGCSRARPGPRLRRHRLSGHRRHHARRRYRLSGPQARADHRQPAGRGDRDRRRRDPATLTPTTTRTSSGRSAVAAATSGLRRASCTGSIRPRRSSAGSWSCPAPPRPWPASLPRRGRARESCPRSPT